MGKGGKTKKVVKSAAKKANPLFEKKPRNFRTGNSIQPKRNLTRFVKWPKYIIFQRQKRILLTRLKVPPVLAQFSRALERNQARVLFKLLQKYSPEDNKQKKERLTNEAKLKAESNFHPYLEKSIDKQRPHHLKFGLNHVTKLIE
jgi:large subunit ribosomal protein L7Ae